MVGETWPDFEVTLDASCRLSGECEVDEHSGMEHESIAPTFCLLACLWSDRK